MDADTSWSRWRATSWAKAGWKTMCAAPTRAASSACWCSRHAPACWRASLYANARRFRRAFSCARRSNAHGVQPGAGATTGVAGLMRHINDRYRYRRAGQAEVQRTTPQTMRAPPPPSGAGVAVSPPAWIIRLRPESRWPSGVAQPRRRGRCHRRKLPGRAVWWPLPTAWPSSGPGDVRGRPDPSARPPRRRRSLQPPPSGRSRRSGADGNRADLAAGRGSGVRRAPAAFLDHHGAGKLADAIRRDVHHLHGETVAAAGRARARERKTRAFMKTPD